MASSTHLLLSFTLSFLLFTLSHATPPPLTFTLVNNCPFTIWPAIQPNSGHDILLQGGGFVLHTLTHHSFEAPSHHWSGRMWPRTYCTQHNTHFSCATGDCGGRLQCGGAGGAPPATLAQFSIHHGPKDFSSYGVSVVDGYNVPMSITPHLGTGNCPVVGCRPDLLPKCPAPLQHKVALPPHGYPTVVACKSACEAYKTDAFCCRNHYNSPQTCKPNNFTKYFKQSCPEAFTYAHDSPSLMHECSSPRELKIIFCH